MAAVGNPRIVFFGLPGAGKSALAAAFRGGAVEVGGAVEAVDTDGAADADLIAHAAVLERSGDRTRLAETVTAADALVVAVDAAASDAEVNQTFASVRRFLDSFEAGRTYDRAVAGLPVFLTLTKCDRLRGPAEVAERAEAIRARFADYFADEPDGFGTLAVSVAATGGLGTGDGRYGVTNLVRDATAAAAEFRDRNQLSGRRVKTVVSASGTVLALLLVGIAGFFATDTYGPSEPLIAQIRAYQDHEGPPGQRLSDNRLPRNRDYLRDLRDASGFDRLPQDLKDYVDARLAEIEAYSAYRSHFAPPRLGPADVRTAAELDRLDADLATVLQPPTEYANAWPETEAVKLRDRWAADAAAVRTAEVRLHDWYRGLVRRGNGLLLSDPFEDRWKADGDALLRDAATPPARPTDPLPNSSLSYAVPLDFARIDFDKRDWEDAKGRLMNLRDAVASVSPGGVFDFPAATGDAAASLGIGTARAQNLPPIDLAADRFPDPAKEELRKRYQRARETGLRHVRDAVRAKVQADTPAGWKAIVPFAGGSDVRNWERVLNRLAALGGEPDSEGLAAFLRRDSFTGSIDRLEITIPNDLSTRSLTPDPTFVLTQSSGPEKSVTRTLKRIGEPARTGGEVVATYVPDGWDGTVTLAPGDSLAAYLPVASDLRLVWDSNRSKTFAFESLSRPAAIVPATGPRSPATGVKVTVHPAAGIPAVPAVLPDLSAEMK